MRSEGIPRQCVFWGCVGCWGIPSSVSLKGSEGDGAVCSLCAQLWPGMSGEGGCLCLMALAHERKPWSKDLPGWKDPS